MVDEQEPEDSENRESESYFMHELKEIERDSLDMLN